MTEAAVVQADSDLIHLASDYSGWPLRCPLDGSALIIASEQLSCALCSRAYPRQGNVIDFRDQRNDFYEGAYTSETRYLPKRPGLFGELPLWLINSGYIWAVRRFAARGGRLLELGCAGGVAWFGHAYRAAGLDASFVSLQRAVQRYEVGICSDGAKLALADHSIDVIASSYFWEHIEAPMKRELLAEFSRVLAPGGRLVFIYDVATQNPLIEHLRRTDPERYHQSFLERDGHVGYQSAKENDDLFEACGFRILQSRPLERTWLQSPSVFSKMAEWPGFEGKVGRLLEGLSNAPWLHLYALVIRIVDSTVGRWLPRRWGRIMLTVAEPAA